MNSSLSSKVITGTKCSPVIHTNLFKRNISLPTVDDKYSFTRAHNTLVLLITSIESLEPPLYWYNISNNSKGSLCELFRLENCVCVLSITRTCGLIRQRKVNGKTSFYVEKDKWIRFFSQYELINVEIIMSKTSIVIDNKPIRKNITFIRIETKSSSSYLKATTQYNHQVFPPLVQMRQLSHLFLNSISANIIKTIHWYVNERVSTLAICRNTPSNCSKSISTSTSHNNPPILQSMYPILDKLDINTSNLEDKNLNVIFLKNLLSEVSCVLTYNNININLEKRSGRGKKELIQIPSIRHLKYDRFKQNVTQYNFIEQTLKALSYNSDNNYHPLSTINLCRCLVENYEDNL